MADKPTRKRIFAREQVGVDERTPGIGSSSRPSNALGSLYQRQNVAAERSKLANLWSSVSGTLGALVGHVGKGIDEADWEAERERERQQKLEDQRQALAGEEAGNEVHRQIREKVIRGEITDPLQAADYVKEKLDEYGPVVPAVFRNAMQGQTNKALMLVGEEFNQKLSADLQNTGRTLLAGSLNSSYLNIGEQAEEEFFSSINSSIQTAISHGVPQETAYRDAFNSGISAINSALLGGDVVTAKDISDRMAKAGFINMVPLDKDGRGGLEILEQTLRDGSTRLQAYSKKEQQDLELEQDKRRRDNYDGFLSSMVQEQNPAKLKAMEAQVEGLSGEELMERFGPQGRTLKPLLENSRMALVTGKKPDGNAEALREIKERIQLGDTAILWDETALEAYTDSLTKDDVFELRTHITQVRSKNDPEQVQAVLGSISSLHNEFNLSEEERKKRGGQALPYHNLVLVETIPGSDKTTLTVTGRAVQDYLFKAVRQINPADTKYKDNPIQLRFDREAALRVAEQEIRSGKADFLITPQDAVRKGSEGVTKNPLFLSEVEWKEDPQKRTDLDYAIFRNNDGAATRARRIRQIQDPALREQYFQRNATIVAAKQADALARELLSLEKEAEAREQWRVENPGWADPGVQLLQKRIEEVRKDIAKQEESAQ